MEIDSVSAVSMVKRSTSPKMGGVEDALSISIDGQKISEWVEMAKAAPLREISVPRASPSLDELARSILPEILVQR